MVIVDLVMATICFAGGCHNALVGTDTPKGEFILVQRLTEDPGYGGDVLQFKETDAAIFAIHRVWLLKPKQHRADRLKSDNAEMRRGITGGCINLEPKVYQELIDCCSNDKLVIH